MARFLRNEDYYSLIQEAKLDIVLGDDDTKLLAQELAAQKEITAYLKHRYDVKRIFKNLNTFSFTAVYNPEDLVLWTETAFSESTVYTTGQRVSQSGNIYSSTAGSAAHAFDVSEWTLLAENEKLWYANIRTTGTLPSDTLSFTANAYTSRHERITGWDYVGVTTIYFKKIANVNEVRIYKTTANRTADTNVIGKFDYDFEGLELPESVLIKPGDNTTTILGGEIFISGYIADSTEWNVVASNQWTLGDNRDETIVNFVIDIALYNLHSRINPRNVPEFRAVRRDDAIEWLKMAAKGTITPDLPVVADKTQGQRVAYGSNPKKNFQVY